MEKGFVPFILLGCLVPLVIGKNQLEDFSYLSFRCIQQKNYDSMKCVWESKHSSCWQLQYRIVSQRHREYRSCPVAVSPYGEASCTLILQVGRYEQFEDYIFILTDCSLANRSIQYHISTYTDEFVKMDAVCDLSETNVTSSSITVTWTLPMPPSSTHETHRIDCQATPTTNNTRQKNHHSFNASARGMNTFMTTHLTGLEPSALYHIEVRCKPADSVIWGYRESVDINTRCKEPDHGPYLSNWMFSPYQCSFSRADTCIIIYWKDDTPAPGECTITSYLVHMTSQDGNTNLNRTSDSLSAAFTIQTDTDDILKVDVLPETTDGTASVSSVMLLSTLNIKETINYLDVKALHLYNTTYNITWNLNTRIDEIETVYYVYCRGQRIDKYGVICLHDFGWIVDQDDLLWRTIDISNISSEAQGNLFIGVSLSSNVTHTGINWASCIMNMEDTFCTEDTLAQSMATKDDINTNRLVVVVPSVLSVCIILIIICVILQIHKRRRKYDVTICIPTVHGANVNVVHDGEESAI